MTTAVTLASQHNEIVSSESYQKAVNDIKEAVNADFYALCYKLHLEPVLDVEYYEKLLDEIIKTQNEISVAFHKELKHLNETISIGDDYYSTTKTINVVKEFNECKEDELYYFKDLQSKVETALKALRKVDDKVTTLVAALPITETQFWSNVKDIVMKAKNDLSHDIFEYIDMLISSYITDKILEENAEKDLIDSKTTMIFDYTESLLNGIVNDLVSKHMNEKSNVIISSIINEFSAKCCNFITQYVINSHSNDFIILSEDLKETLEGIMRSFKFGLKSWIDSCVDLSMIHEFNTLQQVKSTVRSIMQIFNKRIALQTNLAYYMEEPLEMIKIEDYFDEPTTSTVQPIVQEIDYAVNGPTIESFVSQLEINKFYPTSELLAKYVDYFGDSITAEAFSNKVKGYLENKRHQVDKVQKRGYIRVNKI
jgi:hypothetical protein